MIPLRKTKHVPEYSEEFLDRLETLWGQGFLSPGGAEEVAEIVSGLDLEGKTILDIGCGTGGAAIALAKNHGAAGVIGIDVESGPLRRAQNNALEAGVANRIEFRHVAPGHLPLPDTSVDVVFSKDSMIHIPDKGAIFAEIYRVLRPGGVCAVGDWLAGENRETSPEWQRFQSLVKLSFVMATARESEAVMRAAGFAEVTSRDRNAWYAEVSRQEVEDLEGPLRARVIEIAGEETYAAWLKVRRALSESVVAGAMRPTHLRGFKT